MSRQRTLIDACQHLVLFAHQLAFFFAVFLVADLATFATFSGLTLRGGRASGLLAIAAGRVSRAFTDGSILARNCPV